jgi:Holliday junction DNA helicase RuvA
MIVALEGLVESIAADSIVLKVGPVSLLISVPSSALNYLSPAGNMVRLHTYLQTKEDNIALFGFTSAEELALFRRLLTVSGIGPKVALGLLSTLSAEHVASAIVNGDIDILSKVPGIGKKTAGRIILELKGQLEKEWIAGGTAVSVPEDSDVVAALLSLGYSLREAKQAASAITTPEDLSLEDKLKIALSQLAKI